MGADSGPTTWFTIPVLDGDQTWTGDNTFTGNNTFSAGTTNTFDTIAASNLLVSGYWDSVGGEWILGYLYAKGVTNASATGGYLNLDSHASLYASTGGSVKLYGGTGSGWALALMLSGANATFSGSVKITPGDTFPDHAAGLLYYHSVSNKLYCSDGTNWNGLW